MSFNRKIQKKIKIISILFGTLPFFVSCQRQSSHDSGPLSLFGNLEMEILQSDSLTPLQKALGSLQIAMEHEGTRYAMPTCSGIRISQKHILTADHCVKDNLIFNPFYYAALPLKQGALQVQVFDHVVRLFYEGEVDSRSRDPQNGVEQTAPILTQPVFRHKALDFAIFQLPPSQVEANVFFIDLEDVLESPSSGPRGGSEAMPRSFLYGYPHGAPLAQSLCHQWHRLTVAETEWIFNDCDGVSGNSGGLIVSDQVPLALHLAGPGSNDGIYYQEKGAFEDKEIFARRKGCSQDQKEEWERCIIQKGMNRSLPLQTVKRILQEKAPELWQEIKLHRS